CQRYLSGAELSRGESQLMRSRDSAFVMKDADYLIKTWHPSCQAQTFRPELETGSSQTAGLGLTLFASHEARVPNEG
ncbi:YchJ family metal-binding protein, partial [Klebsiella pneumoniae]|nr:YchJ family metal-binding protein [Klebsiella pneumoniae]